MLEIQEGVFTAKCPMTGEGAGTESGNSQGHSRSVSAGSRRNDKEADVMQRPTLGPAQAQCR